MRIAAVVVVLAACRLNFEPQADATELPPDASVDGPGALVSRGVVARYFLDDGEAPAAAKDAIDPPVDLSVTYVAGDPVWHAVATGRGMRFEALENDAGACAPVTGKVRDAFEGSTTATLEVVVDYSAGIEYGSRMVHVGEGDSWSLALGYSSATEPLVWFSVETTDPLTDDEYRRFAIDLADRGRVVLTLVFDTDAPDRPSRARLFADGVELPFDPTTTFDTYDDGEKIQIRPGGSICVGNRAIGGRTPVGSIYYAALYATALAPTEIQANVARLLAWDDH